MRVIQGTGAFTYHDPVLKVLPNDRPEPAEIAWWHPRRREAYLPAAPRVGALGR